MGKPNLKADLNGSSRLAPVSLLGSIHLLNGEWWVVINHTRTRLTLKRADSEMHAIRLKVQKTQCQMSDQLKICQSYYSKLESEVLPCPPRIIEAMRAMLPNGPAHRPEATK